MAILYYNACMLHVYTCNTYEILLSLIVSFSSRSYAPVLPLPFSVFNFTIYIITIQFMFFSFFFLLKNKSDTILLWNYYVVYN